MTLEEVLDVMKKAEEEGKTTVRLHTGDPCLYGAIQEQMDALDALGISYEVCPGVSSFCGAAAALQLEYTLPSISQSVLSQGWRDVPCAGEGKYPFFCTASDDHGIVFKRRAFWGSCL